MARLLELAAEVRDLFVKRRDLGTELGMVDEAFAPQENSTYRMATDGVLEPGAHLLAFRLDELAGAQAAVDVANAY